MEQYFMNTSPRYSVAGFLGFGISKPPWGPGIIGTMDSSLLTLVKYLKKWSTIYGLDTILLVFYSWYCSSNHHQASKRWFLGSLADLSRNTYIYIYIHILYRHAGEHIFPHHWMAIFFTALFLFANPHMGGVTSKNIEVSNFIGKNKD